MSPVAPGGCKSSIALIAAACIGALVLGVDAAGAPAPLAQCSGGGAASCVIDGDTFRIAGETIRMADIDTPEVHGHGCPAEKALGERATRRLVVLLNAGPFALEPIGRDTDRYGRSLRIVTRDGQSLGDVLVAEGLARHWSGARQGWC